MTTASPFDREGVTSTERLLERRAERAGAAVLVIPDDNGGGARVVLELPDTDEALELEAPTAELAAVQALIALERETDRRRWAAGRARP